MPRGTWIMNLPDLYYTITPRVFAVGKQVTFTLRGLRAWARRPSNATQWGRLVLRWIATGGLMADGKPANWNWFNENPVEMTDDPDAVRFTLGTEEEGEICCQLRLIAPDDSETVLASFSLYALETDLLVLRPWRGELHCHSSWSRCGNQDENPYTVAICAREKGLDFMALTDHLQMKPSRRAAKFFRGLPTDFLVVPGEEIHILLEHTPSLDRYHQFWPYLHIVNFGGRQSVAAYMNEHIDALKAAWQATAESIHANAVPELRYFMAASDWVFDQIRAFGGLSVFCHPFWKPYYRFNLPVKVNEYILEQHKYDCMEVFGLGGIDNAGFVESNRLALAWWQEECFRRGRTIPLVGTSDSHDSARLLGGHSTIVFPAPGRPRLAAVQQAIRDGFSVAAVCEKAGDSPQLYGAFRLVRYAYFLWRQYFPAHNELCRDEARMMAEALNGVGEPDDRIARKLREYARSFWGKRE